MVKTCPASDIYSILKDSLNHPVGKMFHSCRDYPTVNWKKSHWEHFCFLHVTVYKISEFWPADKSNHLRASVWRMESYSLAVEEELRLSAFTSRWFKASLKDQSALFQPAVVPISVSAVSLWVMLTSAVESQGNKVQAPSSFPPNPSKNGVLH